MMLRSIRDQANTLRTKWQSGLDTILLRPGPANTVAMKAALFAQQDVTHRKTKQERSSFRWVCRLAATRRIPPSHVDRYLAATARPDIAPPRAQARSRATSNDML
jgi:hypothetical protein